MAPALCLLLVLVLAPGDTTESRPAPLIVPGRPSPADTTRVDPKARAREEYLRGRELERLNADGPAIVSYALALRHDPDIPDANYRIGLLELKSSSLMSATRAFAAELKRHPDNLDAARELGLALARLGRHDSAVRRLEALVKRAPQDGRNWRALGFAQLLAGQPQAAESALRRAIALPPPSALEHRDLGYVLAQTGREAEARAEYRKAIAMDPKETGAWVNLANLARKDGDLAQALTDFREAEKRDSTLALAVSGQALVLRQLGRDEEAAATYRRLLDLDPTDRASRFDAIQLFDSLGRGDIALQLARDGVRAEPGSGAARLLLGLELQGRGRTREAVLELRRAHALLADEEGRARAERLIANLRAQAPATLRAQLDADSVAFERERTRAARARPLAKPSLGTPDSTSAPALPDSR
ncbi:MAG TPA: tetratricopeptide repeat protein [Terriglobales bacterium]|nr:tetratricopeptide repeat protein [Terriglobales bacterium]